MGGGCRENTGPIPLGAAPRELSEGPTGARKVRSILQHLLLLVGSVLLLGRPLGVCRGWCIWKLPAGPLPGGPQQPRCRGWEGSPGCEGEGSSSSRAQLGKLTPEWTQGPGVPERRRSSEKAAHPGWEAAQTPPARGPFSTCFLSGTYVGIGPSLGLPGERPLGEPPLWVP